MGGLMSSYNISAAPVLVYNLDAAALGGRPGTTITTSASFDGSTQRLSTTGLLATGTGSESTGTNMGTGDFTWECWVRPTGTSGAQTFIDTRGNSTGYSASGNDGAYFGTVGTGDLSPMYYSNATVLLTSTIALTLNTWAHVALVRSSGTVTIYVNGVSGGSVASDTTDLSAPYVVMGGTQEFGGGLWLTGQISNLRMVKGTAVYTTAFTPQTTTLRAIAGTNLLMPLIASPFMDLSVNILPIVNTGTVATTAQAPSLTTGTTDLTNTYTLTYSLPVATFTGSSTGTTLTVASGLTGTVTTGMTITGGSIPTGTYIVNQLTGTTGSTGTYTISASVSQASTSITGARINWAGTQGGIFTSYFSGDGIGAYITGGPNIAAATKYTVMVAYKLNTGAAGAYGRLLNSNTGSPDWLAGGYSSIPKVWYSNGQTINLSGSTDTVWHIDFLTFNLATGNIFSSTSAQPTATPTYTLASSSISGFNQLKLYSKSDGNECAAGNIGMVKVWTGVLSTAQMQAQYAAYKARFGY
jgi:hypothetical protein